MLTQVALLAGLIACISLVWLVGRAFLKHPAWGFAVLILSPLTAVAFGIRYWRDEKGPFLVYLVAFPVAITLGIYVFTAAGWRDIMHSALPAQHSGTPKITGQPVGVSFAQASLNVDMEAVSPARDGMAKETGHNPPVPIRANSARTGENAPEQVASEPGEPKVTSAKPIETKQRYRATYIPIKLSTADNYVGMTVKVKRINRPEVDCVLKRVTPTVLAFQQHGRGGTFSFNYPLRDIERLRVLVKQAY